MSERQVINISTEEAKRQTDIIHILSQSLKGKNLKYCVSTFGCQMNARDSEKIEGMLEEMGYEKITKEDEADFVIYNTCCVRENAEMKIYGRLGHLKTIKKKNPNLIIALCGCMMQQDIVLETLKKKYNFVDIIFGTYNIYKLPELLQTRLETQESVIDIWDSHQDIVEDLPNTRKYNFKACVNIMYGCNNFCTYCIVPYVRGRERSRELSDILNEVKALVADGVKEVMFLGQNVNSYGQSLSTPVSFANLLSEVSQIEGLKRIRFMTSHPKDLSDELIEVIAECDNVCKSVHLPIQAGSTHILKSMNRKYTKESYLELVSKLRTAIPHIEITTDFIVGFPGETEEDFLDTLDVVEKVKYAGAFTFIYSKRTGTPAATMEEQVPEEIVKKRFNKLLTLTNDHILENMKKYVGQTVEVLFEETSKNDKTVLSGRTDTSILVNVKAPDTLIGHFAQVKIVATKTHYLIGELVE
ncbi:tRNA (N6-isopentenyl adenosine(37)-C2)-methylthiotransferase MiaB [Cellulosilyticum sp. I15G10I2]|uniref:tRNA (N6-isopentenyl adenosine(37)-C2)-methylthiotransferase MiaB n=1 Tax=Cellulosilyticum sp. I15G10I2 TaxID=1892843 RepID=UPI00085C8E5B|nr:tRNA (N6-isopentenyl adenosine(37)-C2)-methylthiotransferase MiaB [Cellulosilyticum sp. I15G10I2]